VSGLGELALEVGDRVHDQGDTREGEVDTGDGDTGTVSGLECVVHKEHVCEDVRTDTHI